MNKSSNGLFAVIIVVLLIAIGLYFVLGMGSTSVVAPSPTSTTPIVTPPTPDVPPQVTTTTVTTPPVATSTPFVLTVAQKQALLKYGISSSSIPNTFTMAQEACFVTELGLPRVMEIKKGAIPTGAELLKVKGCL